MAEARNDASDEQETSRVKYFCHQCADSIFPNLPDYTCPNCNSGFIEEFSPDSPEQDEPAQQVQELWERTFLGPRRRFMTPGMELHGHNLEAVNMDFIIGHILQSLTGSGGILPMNLIHLHGDPGDYAWGEQGLDSIVTQLLNQLEGSGPPPATREQMEKLPTRTITDSDLERTLQCSVCFEEYGKGESVRCLPCQHVYHDDCIFPWLEKHGTCPVCRKDLEGKDTTTEEAQPSSSAATTTNGFVDDSDDCD